MTTLFTFGGVVGEGSVLPPRVSVLAPYVATGVFGPYEVHLAATMARLEPGLTDEVILALAVAARAPRFGHVCMELGEVARRVVPDDDGGETESLPWPSVDQWAQRLSESNVVSSPDDSPTPTRPLVWDGRRLYLQRYWQYELAVAGDLSDRAARDGPDRGSASPTLADALAEQVLDAMFEPGPSGELDLQRLAAQRSLGSGVSIIAGGPGTGKTRTVARLLAAAHLIAAAEGRELKAALAAPTGKAAARLEGAVTADAAALRDAGLIHADLAATLAASGAQTVHRLLGWRPGTHFRHDRQHPLPHDLVIVDETSMVSLPLMAKLLGAVRPEARLVLVGDPFQLSSIEAGTVMADLVGPGDDAGRAVGSSLAGRVTVLRRMRRFGEDSGIASLAEALRAGDADGVLGLLDAGRSDVHWVRDDDPEGVDEVVDVAVAAGIEVAEAAVRGDAGAALDAAHRIKVLAAVRRGPLGLFDWSDRIETGVAAAVADFDPSRRWHSGRPIIVTRNDQANGVFNGDVGVVTTSDGETVVAFPSAEGLRSLPPSRLDQVETWWAMTIHKSQGSEFRHAVVALPHSGSPILTRELLFTAVTRAKEQVTVVSSEASLRLAIGRPIARASGLKDRLWPA